ncbi:terpene synthase family protein [Sorangium sp. So ce385]|uniref:terpene synthase family protein n=1 Tax=Sorangium sp. So ce385 TaxID=3133308 RepID=UPI003F5AEAB1
MNLNPRVLERLIAFGDGLEGFAESYAVDGLEMAHGMIEGVHDLSGRFVPGIGVEGDRALWIIALDLTWLLWLDDRIDTSAASARHIDWKPLLHVDEQASTSAEGLSFIRMRAHMAREAATSAAFTRWQDTAVDLFHAYRENWLLSAGERTWGYAEYLQNGEISIALPHFITAVSLACNYGLESRTDAVYTRIIRNLALATRLQNDVASAEKERSIGDRANAVLLVERFMTQDQAREFVQAERSSYERALLKDLERLPAHDLLVKLANVILATMDVFYQDPRERYMVASPLRAHT